MTKKRTMYVRNRQGVKVKKCCASCQHKCVNLDGTRLCALVQLIVNPDFRCRNWEMMEKLQNAGKGDGKLKSRKYLEFVHEVRMQEQEAIEEGSMTLEEKQSVNDIRKQFEDLFDEKINIDF